MVKDNYKGPDFLVPIPYVPEDEKEADPSDGKPPSVKLEHVQPIFNGGTTEQFLSGFRA
jgi:hypothetical protein